MIQRIFIVLAIFASVSQALCVPNPKCVLNDTIAYSPAYYDSAVSYVTSYCTAQGISVTLTYGCLS